MISARSYTSNFSLIVLFWSSLITHAVWNNSTIPRQIIQLIKFQLGECGPKAILKDNRYYYRDNIRYANEPIDITEPVLAITDFDNQLNDLDIELIVIPIPSKASTIRPNHTEALVEKLRSNGVEVISPPLRYDSYLEHDTHWNTDGIRETAKIIANRLGATRTITGNNIELERYGDIIEMLDNSTIKQLVGTEHVNCEQFKLPSGNGILFIGDSYLRIFESDKPGDAGLISHVGSYLGYRPTSIINDGGGSTLVRQRLALKPKLLDNIKVVIWVFADRDIRFGIDGWQQITIPASH